jgi:hypothetical protein
MLLLFYAHTGKTIGKEQQQQVLVHFLVAREQYPHITRTRAMARQLIYDPH